MVLLCYLTGAERPIHCSENVADILTRWSYWPDEFRHSNYLVMKPYSLIRDIFQTTVSCVFVNLLPVSLILCHGMVWFWYKLECYESS